MSTFTIILLIIIFVLIASDVFFLWKIFKSIGSRKKSIPDERYFELKYNINLLKAVSATLIFLLGFLGFTTYQDITKIVESDFEEKFTVQQIRIDKLDSIVKEYEETVKLLKSEEGKSIENLNDVRREFGIINKKVTQTQEALRYTSRMYVVNGIKNNHSKFESFKLYFKDLTTMDNEKLPNFNSTPVVSVQSTNSLYAVEKITKEYVQLKPYMGYMDEKEALLNLWIFYRHQ